MNSIQIIIGSMLGNSEYVAEAVADVLTDAGYEATLHVKPNFDEIEIEKQIWLICTSTHGTGELPDNIKSFAENLENTDKDLSNLQFAIIGLGDSGYDSFCRAAFIMEELMTSKHCIKLVDKLLIDTRDGGDDSEEKAEVWMKENIAKF